VLLVRADNLGDVVTATPTMRALRAALPDARIDLLASPAGAAAAPLLPWLDDVLVVSASWQQLDPTRANPDDDRDLLARLRAGGYDAMVVLTSRSQSPWPLAQLGFLAGIGVRAVHSAEFGGAAATHWVSQPPERMHQVDRGLHLLAGLGIGPAGRDPELVVPAAARDRAGALLADPAGPFALLVPGASCPSRRYPPERFGAAAALLARAGLAVRVCGTRAEAGLVDAVVAAAGDPQVRALEPVPVPEFAALTGAAAVVVANNSAAMHLADATGTPVVVTHGGTERLTDVRPRQVPAVLLRAPVSCSPCRQLRCPYDADLPACLDLAPARVAAAALGLARPDDRSPIDVTREDPWWTTHALISRPVAAVPR
jgi:ADP-heptose:LPS heptosyltransferase